MPTPIIFLAVLSVLVLIHELGHFVAALLFRLKVEEFAFGLPFTPPLISKKIRNIKFSVYPLIFGGFVKLYGEEGSVKENKNRSFYDRGKLVRIIVVAAGVVMNVVLALVGMFVLYGAIGLPQTPHEKVTITQVAVGSPADKAGLQVYDRVIKVEDKEIKTPEEFTDVVKSWAGLEVNLTVERGKTVPLFEGLLEQEKQEVKVFAIPRKDPPPGEGALGVAITPIPYLVTQKCALTSLNCQVEIVKQGVKSTGVWGGRVIEGLRQIGKSLAAGQAPEGVSGPVGIYKLTEVVVQEGWLPTIELIAVLSVNLAVFNILPIPALDGGRILFIVIEGIRRKRLSAEFEQRVNAWGMAILLLLVALITLQDLIVTGVLDKILGKR